MDQNYSLVHDVLGPAELTELFRDGTPSISSFHPFDSNSFEDAVRICKQSQSVQIFEENIMTLFSFPRDGIREMIQPNRALLERITFTIMNYAERKGREKLLESLPAHYPLNECDGKIDDLVRSHYEIEAEFVRTWFETFPEASERKLATRSSSFHFQLLDAASFVLDQNQLKSLFEMDPQTAQEQFFRNEVCIIRMLLIAISNTDQSQQLCELEETWNRLVDDYNSQFERYEEAEACIECAEVLIECYWMISSFLALRNIEHRLNFARIKTKNIITPMISFWENFPPKCVDMAERKYYHRKLCEWMFEFYTVIDNDLITSLLTEQMPGMSGIGPKVFVLFHATKQNFEKFVEIMLKYPDNTMFFNTSSVEPETLKIDQISSMLEGISIELKHFHTKFDSMERLIIASVFHDVQCFLEYFRQRSSSFQDFAKCIQDVQLQLQNAVEAGNMFSADNKHHDSILSMMNNEFAPPTDQSFVSTHHCFSIVSEALRNVPMFHNSMTPYRILIAYFNSVCYQQNLELRTVLVRELAEILLRTEDCVPRCFLLELLAETLKTSHSENLMKKSNDKHEKDLLMLTIEQVMRETESQMERFNPEDLDKIRYHLHPTLQGLTSLNDHRCQLHIACLSILTFHDRTHVFSPLDIWFESLNRVLEIDSKTESRINYNTIAKSYCRLLREKISASNLTSNVQNREIWEIIRDATPLLFVSSNQVFLENFPQTVAAQLCKPQSYAQKEISSSRSVRDNPLITVMLDRLNRRKQDGALVPRLAQQLSKNYKSEEVLSESSYYLNLALDLSWNSSVQNDKMEYIFNVADNQINMVSVYFQFKFNDDLSGSECITLTVGNDLVKIQCNCDELALNWTMLTKKLFAKNNHTSLPTKPFHFAENIPCGEVRAIVFHVKNDSLEVVLVRGAKKVCSFPIHKWKRNWASDEVKLTINSLFHTIPLMFEGDYRSAEDVHRLGITPGNIDQARRIVSVTKVGRLRVGKVWSPVIPIRHNQPINFIKDKPGFDNIYEQLRSVGGFGFIFHLFTNMILDGFSEELCENMCKTLASYLGTLAIRDEKFSRKEAVQMTSLLLRSREGLLSRHFVPSASDIGSWPDKKIGQVIFWEEFLSESTYWETHLSAFYHVIINFNRSKPGVHLDKFLRLILEIVSKIIRKDNGSDDVCDIIVCTLEMLKKWCSEAHKERTALLVTFMMELFDLKKISQQFEKFLWVEESVLEKEVSRQPILVLSGDEEAEHDEQDMNVDLLQLDLPIKDDDNDYMFVMTPTNTTRNRDYMMKRLLKHLLQLYVLCPDSQYACLDSITAEKICYLLEVADDGEIIALLIEMYESIINHNVQSERIARIFRHKLLLVLARQLRNKPLTEKSVNALFSILLGEQVDVSAGLDTAHIEAFSPNGISCQAVAPLLTIFEESVDYVDITVFTVVCTSLNKIYIHNNQLTQAVTAAGIDESMTAVLLKLAKMGDFRRRNEKLKALLDPWIAFSVSIMRVGVNGRKSVFEGASRFINHLLLLYTQENGKLLDDPDNEAQRLKRDNIYWALCILLLQLFKFLLDIALSDSNKHRSASNSSLHMMGYDEDPEEIEATPTKPTKFWDELAHKVRETMLGPNQNLLKCPYRKHKETPLTAEEIRNRIREVLTLCQYFFKITTRVDSDEEDNLYHIFFHELSMWALEEAWPNCIWVAADMMFVTNVFANCVAFVLTDIHQYMFPFKKVFNRQKNSRIEILLQRIMRSYTKISTVFGNIMDIDQMIRLSMENITRRENSNSNLFKLAVLFLNTPNRERKGSIDYPQPMNPDLIQKLTVESDIASRYWLDQRNEVIAKINLKWRTPQTHLDVTELNYHLDILQKRLGSAKNVARINEICQLVHKIEENERVFTRLTAIHNNFQPRRISTTLGPRGERMITDMTNIKSSHMFNAENSIEINGFRKIYHSLSLAKYRRTGLFTSAKSSMHGVLYANGVQTNPIFQVDHKGITALPCGAHLVEKTYLFEDVTLIFKRPMRPWDALEVSFEILLKTHETILIYSQQKFATLIHEFAGKLIANETHLLTVTKQWEEGRTSNFEYLMMLNLFAGRTIHDSSIYPIFPRILTHFGDDNIDLLDKTIYRKLNRPVAAQDNASVERHKQHYDELMENQPISHLLPYHYGSMCSNRGVVTFYNIRLLPFGEEAIELQDGRFDFPDRLFHSIESGLGMGKVESNNDYKEFVPELFTTVEVLRNENGNKFGSKQNGEAVQDVEVPKWCHVNGKPMHEYFIYLHRQALESEQVQSMLHHWIDLVFGYKSRGKAALEATNVYHPAVYPGNPPPSGFDSLMINAFEANQKTLGTAPHQLFNHAHPKRDVVSHRHGTVRNMRNLAFGRELTVGEYEFGECTDVRQTSRGVWRKMKTLKSKIFNRSDRAGESESVQLFKKSREKKEKDPSEVNVKINDASLILNDGTTEVKKEHSKKLTDVSVDDLYVACLIHQGSIEIYKMAYVQPTKLRASMERMLRNEHKTLSIDYYGTILAQEGHYTSVDLCASFSTVFAIHKLGNDSVISVWDLHTHHIRSKCSIKGIMVSCGVLKSFGELILVEQWTGNHIKYEKIWRSRERKTKKNKYCGKIMLEHTEQILAKVSVNAKTQMYKYSNSYLSVHSGVLSMPSEPGMGIQTLAMIRQDNAIVLFETLTMTVMRVFEVDNRMDFCLRELRYQEDNTLLAIYKQARTLRKRNRNSGILPPTRTWYFKPK